LAAIPVRWHQPFHNKVLTYLNGYPQLAIDDVLRRFERLARRQFAR
jgi:hypothetical protein